MNTKQAVRASLMHQKTWHHTLTAKKTSTSSTQSAPENSQPIRLHRIHILRLLQSYGEHDRPKHRIQHGMPTNRSNNISTNHILWCIRHIGAATNSAYPVYNVYHMGQQLPNTSQRYLWHSQVFKAKQQPVNTKHGDGYGKLHQALFQAQVHS